MQCSVLALMLLRLHFDCELCKLLLDVQLADKAIVTTKQFPKNLPLCLCCFHNTGLNHGLL